VLRLRDTAGLRATRDPVEAEGVTRARRAIESAELTILVLDGSRVPGDDERTAIAATESGPRIVVCNKLDLGLAGADELRAELRTRKSDGRSQAYVEGSVLARKTIEEVRAAVARLGWGGAAIDANAALVANARQISALVRASEALEHARTTLSSRFPLDMASGDLRGAVQAFGEVTGEEVTEEVLDGIFSRFCVGK